MKLFQVTVVLLGLLAGIDAASVRRTQQHLRTSNGGTRIELLQTADARGGAPKKDAKKVAAKAPDPESAMTAGQMYSLCWSINVPLTPPGLLQIDAEVDVNAAIDFETTKGGDSALSLSASISGYISFIIGVKGWASVKIIVMLTLSASLKISTKTKDIKPLELIKMVLAHAAKESKGTKDGGKMMDKSAIEVMDVMKTGMGVEQMWMGFRKIRQGIDKPNTLTNSLVRQSLVWDNSLRNGLLDAKGKLMDDKALAKLVNVNDFKTGMAIPKLMGITGLGATLGDVPCADWEENFNKQIKAKKNLVPDERKLTARRPGLLCTLLYTYANLKKKKVDDMGLLMFTKVEASKSVKVADVIADLDVAFSEASGNGAGKGLFDYANIWSAALPAVKNEIIEQMTKATDGLKAHEGFTVTGELGLSLGVSVEVSPPSKKCDMATFTLGFTAGWVIEFGKVKKVTATKTIEAKFSANSFGAKDAPTFKGVVYAESALLSKDPFQKIGMTFEWDNKLMLNIDAKQMQAFVGGAAELMATGKITAVTAMLGQMANGGAAAIAKGAIKAAVGALLPGSVALSSVFVLDAEYDLKSKEIVGGISAVMAVDINMNIPGAGAGVGGTYAQGKRVAFKIDAKKSKDVITALYTKVFGGKAKAKAKATEQQDEAGAPNEAVCDACTNTIMDKLNHQEARGKCSHFEDAEAYATCKLVKEELEAAYVISGFTDKNSHWYKVGNGRGSSTWQMWEPLFRSSVCGTKTGKEKETKKFMTYNHPTRTVKKRNVQITFDASSKEMYCGNVASAADDMVKLAKTPALLKVAENSWRGFCRGFGFCPDRLSMAADEYREKHAADFKNGVQTTMGLKTADRVETKEQIAAKDKIDGEVGKNGQAEGNLLNDRMKITAAPKKKLL